MFDWLKRLFKPKTKTAKPIPATSVHINYKPDGTAYEQVTHPIFKDDDGYFYAVYSDPKKITIFKTELPDNGNTWTSLYSMEVKGKLRTCHVYLNMSKIFTKTITVMAFSDEAIITNRFHIEDDEVTVNAVRLGCHDTNMSSIPTACSSVMDSKGHIHCVWSGKSSAYPNSYDLRYTKLGENETIEDSAVYKLTTESDPEASKCYGDRVILSNSDRPEGLLNNNDE